MHSNHIREPSPSKLPRSVWISPRTCFKFTGSTRPRRSSFGSNFGAARCWSSSRRDLLAWSAWRPAPRDRRLGEPVMGHAILERVLLFGTRSADYIRASGHNGCIATEVTLQATTEAEYMTAPERFADSQIPLAPRAPSIHDPSRKWCVHRSRVQTARRTPNESPPAPVWPAILLPSSGSHCAVKSPSLSRHYVSRLLFGRVNRNADPYGVPADAHSRP